VGKWVKGYEFNTDGLCYAYKECVKYFHIPIFNVDMSIISEERWVWLK